MKARHLPAFIYLVLVSFAITTCATEAELGLGTLMTFLLTLPWSMSMVIFAWTFMHDGARSLLVFLVPFAGLNFFLLFKLMGHNRRADRDSLSGPAA
jgi:hypothetical protein